MTNYMSEDNFLVVPIVQKWSGIILEVLGRQQSPTAATGCCGYNGVKQSLGIRDVLKVMQDIKGQIQSDMEINLSAGYDGDSERRDLFRIESALRQVHHEMIDETGWFSDFLAVYVCKVYGVSVLIIRENGNFTFIQVLCFEYTFFVLQTINICIVSRSCYRTMGKWVISLHLLFLEVVIWTHSTLFWEAMVTALH